jgi:hypothetical protein
MTNEKDPKTTRHPFETLGDLPQEVADYLADKLGEDPSFSVIGAMELEVERDDSGEIIRIRPLPEREKLDP